MGFACAAQSLEDEIGVLRQQAAARRLQPRPAPGNELLDYLRTLEPCAVAELTAGADSDILGAPPASAQPGGCLLKCVLGGMPCCAPACGVYAKNWPSQCEHRSGLQDVCGSGCITLRCQGTPPEVTVA